MKPWVIALLVAAVGCHGGPSKEDCEKLRDHLIELELKKAGDAATSDAMKNELATKKAVSDNVSKTFMDTCTNKMSNARVQCALAKTKVDGSDGVAGCDER